MSKQGKRKITVELPKSKDLANRPSVFERLGTKKAASAKKTTEHCRQWAQHGSCAYGKNCKFATTHTLISPSKQRAANKDSDQKRVIKDDGKNRLHSTVVVRRSPDGEIDNWDQNDLEYADTDVLEKRRLQLQRELELQLKMDSGKDMRKDKKKTVSSSSSSRSSSSSSVSSSSSDGSTSSSSSGRDARRKGKKIKLKRNSSSSSDGDAPSKKKFLKSGSVKRDKCNVKKSNLKKDDKLLKKHEADKKKALSKAVIGKKSLSPGKKSGGTPPITTKTLAKGTSKHSKSPQRRDRNRSISPHSARDRDKDRDRKEREKDRDKDRDKERDRTRGRSRSLKKGRSRSPRRHGSHSKDPRRKESSERSRPVSPKKQVRRDGSSERHRKSSPSRDRGRDHKDRSTERRKEKHDDKDRHDRKDRGRERNKEPKRDDGKRRGRERGLGGRGGADKGLEKPNKPMERLLPRPEERLAALAAISNRALEADKNSSTSKERQDTHSERGGRKQDRLERDRSSKRDRMDSMDRDQADYEMGMDRQYDDMEHYDRVDDRYDGPRDDDRSPGYGMQGRDRHYDSGYDMGGPPRGYPEDDDRMFGDHMGDHRGVDMGYDDRRPHRDRSWEGRSGSMDRERGYMHPHKEWDNEDYRAGGDWGRERHWPMREPQMNEWGDKDMEMEGWHHRGHPPGPHRGRMHDDYRGMRMRNDRRGPRNEASPAAKETPPPAQTATAPPRQEAEVDDKPIPDDLSEISDDPDDILNRDDMGDQNLDEDSQTAAPTDEGTSKPECSEKESTQDTSGAAEEKESQDPKDEEDVTNLDFEEISDGELEEERTRAGLGDALGVDWASLVADVRRREQTAPVGGARDRWRPERVLARLGLSVNMAGKNTVQDILQKNAESQEPIPDNKADNQDSENPEIKTEQNGNLEEEEVKIEPKPTPDVNSLHPVAVIQVAIQKRKKQRAVLFGSGCEITRGLSARRDLALRRFLCHLPVAERTGQSRVVPQPSLFQAARALLMQASVTG
ncbi:zinc finger CCCH domain-containing protein 13-like [Pectinophora gossypiella]|uniref:zinc finger CCCH domain-containing protein 13-like n=1 Tax=Pectinophora gossypiella TaxID=13191 RepID=UPI00214F25B2|nr:zinc finger CCCH domain-containing protein 13-like [Pectinophora gossypiella]